jgi:glycolate oxidase
MSTTPAAAPSPTNALAALRAALPADRVIADAAELAWLATDVYRAGDVPVAAIRPRTIEELAAGVKAAVSAGLVIVPRGGGASYTDGYARRGRPALLIDTRSLDSIDVDEVNATVTVGSGVTWAALKEKLDGLGWRTPFWGPFSGIAATIGGSVSQNSISHGSGAYGSSAPHVTSMEVVLASGERLVVGAAAAGGAAGIRNFGPDLLGLFTGDCGALGVKAKLTLPLYRRKPAFACASFAFPTFAAFHGGLRAAAIEGLDDEHFALDAALSQGQIAREERAGRTTSIAASVLKTKGFAAGLAQLAKMGVAGTRALRAAEYSCHYILEGIDDAEAQGRVKRLRAILADYGNEIPNTVPTVVRGMPFAPLFNTLGPKGERWVPLHGLLAHDAVLPFHVALDAFYEARATDMQRLGIWYGGMFTNIGTSAMLYEIALYWPDEPTVYHQRAIDPTYMANLPKYPANPEARAYVDTLKKDLVKLYAAHGAAHYQVGRAYPLAERLTPAARQLLTAIKASLDPQDVMNPGVLGLGAP